VSGLSYITGNQSITVSGDATGSGTTSINLTLANTAVTPGTYGSTTLVPVVTVDSKGRITSVTTAAISGSLTFTGDVTGTGTTGTTTSLTLANSGVTIGTYTKVTVDSKGRVTVGASATTSDISEGTNLYYTDARVLSYLSANTYATQSYVNTQVSNLVASAPATLDTLNELASALGNDPSFATTISTALGNRLRVDINTQGLSATLQGYGRTNLGLGTAATSNTGDFVAYRTFGTAANSATGDFVAYRTFGTAANNNTGDFALASHTHSIANVTGLQTALDGKQASGSYAAATHSHIISDVTGLQTALDGKQASLGFTPYNSTNPAGYITGVTNISGTAGSTSILTASGALTTQQGSGTIIYSYALTNPQTGLFSTSDNSNSILTFNRHSGDYYSQLGFNSSGGIFYRSFNATAINTSQAWQTIWTSTSLTNLNQLTNGPGYITGVTNISGTAGSISGFNNPTTTASANTIVYRDANGYIDAVYFKSTNTNVTTTAPVSITGKSSGDSYMYEYSQAAVRSFLGLGSLAYSSATIPTNNNQLTNGAGYIGINNQTYFGINNTSNSTGNGISFYGAYGGGEMNYGIMFAGTPTFGTHGSVTGDWATYFTMNPDNTRGWIFRKAGSANVASISGGGNASFSGTISASNYSGTHSGTSSGTNTGDQTTVSGNAGTATTFSTGRTNYKGVTDNAVAGQLMWKNYANNHTIFDASASTSPDGGAVNNTNSNSAWTATYPTLMGWNGSSTYGVRVDSARISDTASAIAWGNVSGRPTALSEFTNNLGNYGGWITSSGSITGNAATATLASYSDYVATQTNPVGNFNVGLSRPKGASYTTTTSVVTGAIKIKLPPGTPVHGMWKMTVKIYEYGQRGNGYTIELGCHLYPSTAYNRYQWMLTTDTGAVLPIRYGTDGSSGCVWIGENGTTWSYPQVHVTEFSNGFNNPGGVNWTTGTWAVSIGAIDNSVAVDGPYTTSLIAAAYATTAGSAPANGGNASTVGGYAPSGPIGANTVVIRDANNYIYAYYINSSVSETENPTINSFYTSNGDGWLRKSSIAHVRSQLGNYGGWITSDTTKLPLAGGNMSGTIGRTSHSSGYFVGSYNSVGGNSSNTNPIYTIGSSYTPNDTSLINMYGIGYAHPNFWGSGKTSSWGLYVCEAATINATIGGGAVTIWAQNDIVAYSDERVKDNIELVTNAIEKIQAIRGVTFTRKDAKLEDQSKRHAGVIAQEVLKVMPEIVSGTEKDMYSVAYGNMAALFIEAIKEQQLQIEELKNKLDSLIQN
jgi:hypothetical protein